MENASGIPSALSYSLNTLQGTSFNNFEISPSTGASSVDAGGEIRFQLPNVGLLDMKTSKMTFSVTTTASKGARLPAHTDTLFSSLTIKAGGITLYAGNNFHHILENVKYNMGVKKACGVTGHKDCLDGGDHEGAPLVADNASESYAGLGAASNIFSVDLGDMAKLSPRLLDLSILPSLEISFRVNDDNCLSSIKNGAVGTGGTNGATTDGPLSAKLSIVNPKFYCNMYSLASGAYQQAIRARMDDVGYLSICYDNHLCFNSAFTGSSRFSLSALSLKRLTAVFRRQSATTQGHFLPIVGGAKETIDGNDGAVYGIMGSSRLAKSGISEYQGAIQSFCLPTVAPAANADEDAAAFGLYNSTNPCNLAFKIQSAQIPQHFADVSQQAELTKLAYNVEEFGKAKIMPQYLANYYSFAIPLNLPEIPLDKKTISGLNTNSTNAFLELTSNGSNVQTNGTSYEVMIFACVDTILRVGAGKAIEVLQ